MAGRPCKKSIDELIDKTKEDIKKYEMRLSGLKAQLKEYEEEKNKQEMSILYAKMKEQGMTIEEAINALMNKNDMNKAVIDIA